LKVLITGSEGFIGYHLYNSIKYKFQDLTLINFKKEYFEDDSIIDKLINNADVLIHLSGVNRSDDPKFLYDQNLLLTKKLIESINRVNFSGKLIFTSSTQEDIDTAYGNAKKDSRILFLDESNKNNFKFIGLIIPNVFGPFCRPNYNSFISTFCYNSILGKTNKIIEDNQVNLIYIDNLILKIIESIYNEEPNKKIIKPDIKISVSKVKKIIESFNEEYFYSGIIPSIESQFNFDLFKTFHSYINLESYYPKKLKLRVDERGSFSEVLRSNIKGQYSYSITNQDHIRGNHFHTRKIERFIVISGKAKIELRKIGSDKRISFELSGNKPEYIDMPVWSTHNISNVGKTPLITLFWANEFYNDDNPDTFYEKV
jgi:UDP-2-acetamido-2,6-beta-L-arabino-hexul-4-ose reductase